MSALDDDTPPIRILCFDAGGPGTYSYDVFLKEIMGQLSSELGSDGDDILPCDHFELMAGTGFGGLFALFLGRLGMSVNQATESFLEIIAAIFPDASEETPTPVNRSESLKKALENTLELVGYSVSTRMYQKDQPTPKCNVVIYAATSAVVNHPQAMRTYGSRGATINPTIIEAACATICTPGFFTPVKIGSKLRQQSFVGPPQGAHNPTREAFKEAKAIYGSNRRVAQIVSLGCGEHRVASLSQDHPGLVLTRLVADMSADCDRVAEDIAQRLVNVDAYLRLSVTSGLEGTLFDDWTTLGDVESHTRAYLAKATVQRTVKLSARHLKERLGSITIQQLSEIKPIRITAKCAPAITPFFVERKEALETITRHITAGLAEKQSILTITGMGGCGKTQMVAHTLHRHRSRFEHQIYTNASSLASLQADLQNWMRARGTGYEQATWEDTIEYLGRIDGWVLVFDNADDHSLNLVPYFPKCHHGFIFITSRNRLAGNLSTTTHIELGCMSPDEAMASLLGAARRSGPLPVDELKDAQALLMQLGHLPLAIIQAGSYCHRLTATSNSTVQPFTFNQYAKLMKSHRSRLLRQTQLTSLDQYEQSVYSTLELSCMQLDAKDLEFLQVVCNFDCSDLSVRILEIATMESFKYPHEYMKPLDEHETVIRKLTELLTNEDEWDELGVQGMVANLSSFSIISSLSVNGEVHINVHPLVQAFVCDTMTTTSSEITRLMSAQILTACEVKQSVVVMQLAPSHIRHMIERSDSRELHVNTRMAFASTLYRRGYWELAAQLGEDACQELVAAKGIDDLETIRAMANLATTYYTQGRWDKSERLESNVLEKRRRLLLEDHPDTIQAAADLAATYHKQGRWNKAESLKLEILGKRQRLLPKDHPDITQTIADLASTYHAQGRWEQAESLFADVLERRKRCLPEDHPDIIQSTADLAATYHMQGYWDKAESLYTQVLDKQRRLLPEDHPDTLYAACNLAITYNRQNKWLDAYRVHGHLVLKAIHILGRSHPDLPYHIEVAKLYLGELRDTEKVRRIDNLLNSLP